MVKRGEGHKSESQLASHKGLHISNITIWLLAASIFDLVLAKLLPYTEGFVHIY